MTTPESQSQIPIAAPIVGTREKAAVADVLDSGQLASGAQVSAFESEFAEYCGCEHAVATANGTAALHAALVGLEIGPGDTVVTTPFTFIATANAVRLAGGQPVFADIDRETYNLDPESVERVIRDHDGDVDAIMPVHLYGLPAEMDRLAEIADSYDAALIEDAAQAHGARYRGEPVGAIGDVGCFSFYPTKNMTSGEGGMVVTDREAVADRVRQFVDHGREGSDHVRVGHNFRMTNLAAAIGRVQLERLPGSVEKRRTNAHRLTSALAETALTTPTDPDHAVHAYNQYTVRAQNREQLREHLAASGIDTAIYYAKPVHEEPAYDGVDCTAPEARQASEAALSLPVHPELCGRDIDTIVTAIDDYDRNTGSH